jgi:hypothetical protein
MSLSSELRKTHGAFYTPVLVARYLARWAVRSGGDVLLDPSAGEGVFLEAGLDALADMRGPGPSQVRGIEILPDSCETLVRRWADSPFAPEIVHADFFNVEPAIFGHVDAVIGNPPFVRYQRFSGELRERALQCASRAGVKLPALTSSWAPFLVHAARFIRRGGRMAVVAPAELTYAVYARPVLDYLCGAFASVRILTFDTPMFGDLSEDTILLLADNRGEPFHELSISRVPSISALADLQVRQVPVDATAVCSGAVRITDYLIPARARELYRELARGAAVKPLGELGTAGIGYVTGANDFFHLTASAAAILSIPSTYLRPVVRNGAQLDGLSFTRRDSLRLLERGEQNLLFLCGEAVKELSAAVRRYLESGKRKKVHQAYKCRVRPTWYLVPHVYKGDAFLTCMSHLSPRMAVNEARVHAPNTLLVVKLKPAFRSGVRSIAVAWTSTMTALSCELCGHGLGGGLLKLEPGEASKVLVPSLTLPAGFYREMDKLTRTLRGAIVSEHVDELVRRQLGVTKAEMALLREGLRTLRQRRLRRNS